MKRPVRLLAKTLHVWAGLGLGLLFCLMGLTGSVLVYRHAIEDALRPRWSPVSRARPASVLDAADRNIQQRWPGAVRSRIIFPHAASQLYQYRIRVHDQPMCIYIDSKSGEILGTWDAPWLEWLTGLHHNLRLGPFGRRIVGAIGIGLFLSSLSGLLIWLLHRPRLPKLFTLRGRFFAGRFHFDLHRSIGVMANAFLLGLSFTGICLAFPDTVLWFTATLLHSAPARTAKLSVESSVMLQSLSTYIASATQALPDGQLRELRFPSSPHRPAVARLWRSGEDWAEGSNLVTLDPATGRVLAVDRAADWPTAKRWATLPTPLHFAEWGGPAVRFVWCMAGVMPTVLFVTGLVLWAAGFRARRRAAFDEIAKETVLR